LCRDPSIVSLFQGTGGVHLKSKPRRTGSVMPMGYVVRFPDEADADAIGSVHSRAWRAAYSGGLMPDEDLDRLSPEVRADMWRPRLTQLVADRSARLVVEDPDGVVVGFARIGPEEHDDAAAGGELYAINVDPDSWGTGAGRALHAFALDALRDSGFERAVLWVHPENRRARHFYEALGWRADDVERIAVLQGIDVPEVRYSLNLI